MKLTANKALALEYFQNQFGNKELSNQEMLAFGKTLEEKYGLEKKDYNWLFDSQYRVGRGTYKLPQRANVEIVKSKIQVKKQQEEVTVANLQTTEKENRFNPNAVSEYDHAVIPDRDLHYVAFGAFRTIEKVVKSGMFFPVFISGMSGNGKTFMVEQVCSKVKRPMIRVQIARETDEDDLIGGFRLIDGETRFMKGPVLRAMELGALLLIDEADRADPGKIMCLQGILEGKPYYVKKTGEVVKAAHGFNVIVTANTKGKGSEDGRYVAAGILDDAWLERFPITIEQEYPPAKTEARILNSYMKDNHEPTEEDNKFVENLISWADIIRKTFDEGGLDEVISTRRLVHIVQTYRLFGGNRIDAIELCTNRFDEETKKSILDLYRKVDENVEDASLKSKEDADPVDESPF